MPTSDTDGGYSFWGPPWETAFQSSFAKQPGTHGRGSQLPDRETRSKGPELVRADRRAEMGMCPVLRDTV